MSENHEAVSIEQTVFEGVTKSKHTIKDSVFKDLFSDVENVKKLYLALHPEDTSVSITDISDCTLKSIFVESILNDFSFIVRDKLMVMVEAQSNWSLNIVFRLLSYSVQALSNYVKKTNQDRYGTTLLDLPKVELYVLYTGKVIERYEELSLSELYYQSDSKFLEAKVKVLYGEAGNDIVYQYAEFIRVLHQCCEKLGFTVVAVKKAVEICKNRDVLKEYLLKREVEVVDIITSLFDQDYVTEVHIESEKRKYGEKLKKEFEAQQIENVKKMLQDRLPLELIQRYSQLDTEQIKAIAMELGIKA